MSQELDPEQRLEEALAAEDMDREAAREYVHEYIERYRDGIVGEYINRIVEGCGRPLSEEERKEARVRLGNMEEGEGHA